jgi:trk system potassium uptake protein TrkA
MKTQFAIIGLGRFGSSVSQELIELGYEVLGIDKSVEAVERMKDVLTHSEVADSTDEAVLKMLGIRNFDCVIIAIGTDIQGSTLTAILLKELGVKRVVAKALTELHGRALKKIGVDRVIFPEKEMGIRLAHQLVAPNLLDYIELSGEHKISELIVPLRLSGCMIQELDPKDQYDCKVLVINREDGILIAPKGTDIIRERDKLLICGKKQHIEHFELEVFY